VTAKILRITGVTMFAIICAWAALWAAVLIEVSVLEFIMTKWYD
jgi:hypothetical protein